MEQNVDTQQEVIRPRPDWLCVFSHETADDALIRLVGAIGSEIDREGTEWIANVIEGAQDLPEQKLLVHAFSVACSRRRASVLGIDSEARLIAFPVLLRAPLTEELPSYVSGQVADSIHKVIHEALERDGHENTYVIPMDRLYTSLQFDREEPEFVQEMLYHATTRIDESKDGTPVPSHIMVEARLEQIPDDEAFFAQGIGITYKLYPFVLVTPVGRPIPKTLKNAELLRAISHRLALCAPLTQPDEPNAAFDWAEQINVPLLQKPEAAHQDRVAVDRMYPVMVRVLEAAHPQHAETMSRMMLGIEKVMLDAASQKLPDPDPRTSVEILVNAIENCVDVNFTIECEDGRYGDAPKIAMRFGYTAHSLAAHFALSFKALGFERVVVMSNDAMSHVQYDGSALLH